MQTHEILQQVMDYANQHGIQKFSHDDVTDDLRVLAFHFAYGYQGDFPFMLDMHEKARFGDPITVGMAKGILNCALADARYNKKQWDKALNTRAHGKLENQQRQNRKVSPPEDIEADLTSLTPQQESIQPVIPNGTYTVVLPSGNHRTIRISDDFREDQPEGAQMAAYLYGPDNDAQYQGFAFVQGGAARIWRSFASTTQTIETSEVVQALYVLLQSPELAPEYAHAYALESGRCARCGRTLTVPASIYRGLGPVCAGIWAEEGWINAEDLPEIPENAQEIEENPTDFQENELDSGPFEEEFEADLEEFFALTLDEVDDLPDSSENSLAEYVDPSDLRWESAEYDYLVRYEEEDLGWLELATYGSLSPFPKQDNPY